MKKACRHIALMLTLCLILGVAGTAFAASYRVGALETTYDFGTMNNFQTRNAFCADARGFLKALAFNSAEQQGATIRKLLLGAPDRTCVVLLDILSRLERSQDDYQLTQSERNLLAAIRYYLEANYVFADAPTFGNMDVLVYSVAVVDDLDYTRMLGGRAIVDSAYGFVIELSKLETGLQEQVIQRIATFNGTLEGTKIAESLNVLEYLSPDYEEDPNNPTPPHGLSSFTRNQEVLRLALLEAVADSPHPQLPQEPLAEESAQWGEHKFLIKTDFDALMTHPDNTDWETLLQGAILETASFVKSLASLQAEQREVFVTAFLESFTNKADLEALLFNLQAYLKASTPIPSRQQVVAELEYAILRRHEGSPWMEADFSYYIETEENASPFLFAEVTFWFCLDASLDSYGFIRMLSSLTDSEQEALSSKIKYAKQESYRQAAVDTVYELQRKVELSLQEKFALDLFLEHQSKNPFAIYPTGQEPPATEPVTIPSSTPTEPTAPLFSVTPTADPTAVDSEPAGEDPQEKPPADTGWVSTVCILLGLLCVGIVIATSLAKKKKAQPEPPDPKPAEEPEPELPQPEVVVPVAADPKAYCPAPLDKEVQQQIAQALRQKYDEYSIHWYSEKEPDGTCRCYGTDGDRHIIFYAGGLRMEISDSCVVGESVFYHGTSFELYAYKDGILMDLNIALEKGMVSPQAVKAALAQHEATL